jgi:hypothetical protein
LHCHLSKGLRAALEGFANPLTLLKPTYAMTMPGDEEALPRA